MTTKTMGMEIKWEHAFQRIAKDYTLTDQEMQLGVEAIKLIARAWGKESLTA